MSSENLTKFKSSEDNFKKIRINIIEMLVLNNVDSNLIEVLRKLNIFLQDFFYILAL